MRLHLFCWAQCVCSPEIFFAVCWWVRLIAPQRSNMIEIHDRKCQGSHMASNTIFPWSDVTATIFFAVGFCAATIQERLLFESGIHVFGKPTDMNDGLIRYRRWRLLDAVSSKRSLSVLLSAVETTRTTRIAQALAWWLSSEIIRTRVPRILLATATIRGRCLFLSELRIVRLLFKGGDYLRATPIRKNTVVKTCCSTVSCCLMMQRKFSFFLGAVCDGG